MWFGLQTKRFIENRSKSINYIYLFKDKRRYEHTATEKYSFENKVYFKVKSKVEKEDTIWSSVKHYINITIAALMGCLRSWNPLMSNNL